MVLELLFLPPVTPLALAIMSVGWWVKIMGLIGLIPSTPIR